VPRADRVRHRKPSYDRAPVGRIKPALDSTSPPSLSAIAKAEGFVQAGGLQAEAGPAGCVGCVGRMGLVTGRTCQPAARASILRNVFSSLYLAHLNPNDAELGLKKPTKGRRDPRPSEARARGGRGELWPATLGPINARVPSVRSAGPKVDSHLRKAGIGFARGLGSHMQRVPSHPNASNAPLATSGTCGSTLAFGA
jgi:hypothetical protein